MKSPKVINVQAQNDLTLIVKFDNGMTKTFDVKPLLEMPIYKPLKDVALFRTASIDRFGGITWGNDIDCCRDTLYADGILVQQQEGKAI